MVDEDCVYMEKVRRSHHVSKVGEQMHVGLRATAPTLDAEAAFLSKLQQKQFDVMCCCLVGYVSLSGGLSQISVVPGKAGCIGRLSDAWSPKRQKAVAFGVGVLQQS